ncbi:MAG: DUF998 domain-containing protein [Candidatus Thorarchaeota archaeon]
MAILTTNNKLMKYNKIVFWLNIISSIIFLVLVCIAHYFAILNGYDWQNLELSELVLDSFTSKILFSIACVLEGFCLILLLIPLSLYFRPKKIQLTALVFSLFVCISLIGVGAFPEDIFLVTHYIFGVSFFVFTAFFICFITIVLQKYEKTFPKSIIIFGFSTFAVVIFHISTRWFFGMAYSQRLAVLLSMIYMLVLSGRIIYSVKINETVP